MASKKTKTALLIAGLVVVLLIADGSVTPAERPRGWRKHASYALSHVVAVDTSAYKNRDIYREAAVSVCGSQWMCLVGFWLDNPDLPIKFGHLTDEQVDSQIASYIRNKNSGYDQLLVSCDLFPDVSKDKCF